MKQELIVAVDEWEERCALLEDDRVVEIWVERRHRGPTVGNIYLGRVTDVLPGMEAVFVDIGEDRNAFLFYGHEGYFLDDGESAHPLDKLKKGQIILVQVTKEPAKDKGARLTAQISLAGHYLVGVPFSRSVAVSRKLSNENRSGLSKLAAELQPKDMGLIIRTAASDIPPVYLAQEMEELQNRWIRIKQEIRGKKVPRVVFQESSMPLRLARDVVGSSFGNIYVDSMPAYEELNEYFARIAPELASKIRRYVDEVPVFERFGVEAAIKEALSREARLKTGGRIVIDHTEALTAIDVNSGRFTGGRSLEETVFRTNLAATEEIVRQIRLRDIGGIIVIDFIDMRKSSHRQVVYDTFMKALQRDRVKSQVVEISKMGLIEMTRKKSGEDLAAMLSVKCPECAGFGRVPSAESKAIEVCRKVRHIANSANAEGVLVKVHPDAAAMLLRSGGNPWVDPETAKAAYVLSDERVPVEDVFVEAGGTHEQLRAKISQEKHGKKR